MKKIDLVTPLTVLKSEELTDEEYKLVCKASSACLDAYAPYSGFHVGAAILLDDGTIVTGSNQENAAFPSGMCAERTAAFYAHSQYPHLKFKKIAVSALGQEGAVLSEPVSPCGACRQALLEFEKLSGGDVEVLLHCHKKIYRLPSVKSLLPLSFDSIPDE